MVSEYQLPTPLVPIRESLFVRYCKQQPDGIWAVVDASLDTLRSASPTRCLRHPSGCFIQEIPNGYSKVTWVEHVEVDDRSIHPLYKCLVNSGLAFGAKRWLETLERLCERLASPMAHNFPDGYIGAIATPQGRKNLLKLSERMVVSFFEGVTASSAYKWDDISEACNEDVKVSMRKATNFPSRPFGHVISAATSLWLPVAPRRLFDFLRDETSRNEWDILSDNAAIQEVGCIANGPEQGNCVSVLSVGNKDDILILQESCYNTTGSYVIYAPVDVEAMNLVLSRGDPDYFALLPSGFAVLPDGSAVINGVTDELGSGGSLITIAFQIVVDSPDSSDLVTQSVTTVNQLISCTKDKIKSSISGDDI